MGKVPGAQARGLRAQSGVSLRRPHLRAVPEGMGVVSEVATHSLQGVPEEELVERKPAVALKIRSPASEEEERGVGAWGWGW